MDIVSDLHIDQWNSGNPFMVVADFPIPWKLISNRSPILIVAGDISDDITESLSYLRKLRRYYKKIVYIDGNHEHLSVYPELLNTNEIKKYKNIEYRSVKYNQIV